MVRGKSVLEFIGLIIVEEKIELQNHVLKKVVIFWNVLNDKKQIQRFLSFLNYVRYFYEGQVDDTNYLYKRLRK